ncbi:MAG: hypothetical protein EOO39_28805 [Cytophagaceae bacterium]|nr:MAG: hypothetical protein EOO39_28805 [Cytophagaceae bacterium]
MARFVIPHNRRRRGISMWLFVTSLPLIFGVCGLVVDLGLLQARRAQAQRAADAAALAGAIASGNDNSTVIPTAERYAARNGFDVNAVKRPARVTVIPSYNTPAGTGYNNSVYVKVSMDEPVYFAPIAETLLTAAGLQSTAVRFSRVVSASARAVRIVRLPLSLGGPFGISDPSRSPSNLSVFGPDAYYNFGDPYSTRFNQNGDINPLYQKTSGYYNYNLSVPANYISSQNDKFLHIQIFDPDCYSIGGDDKFDEYRDPNPANKYSDLYPSQHSKNQTTTTYELWKDGKKISEATYSDDPDSNEKWVEPPGFDVNVETYGTGQYQIKVKAIDGSSENGFLLRAGPTSGLALDETAWNDQFGDKNGTAPANIVTPITASENLQMNFTRSGSVKFRLGYLNADQAGHDVQINKFDVDVGSQTITYTTDPPISGIPAGVIPQPGDGVWSTDTIHLPDDWKGGNLYAEYVAGAGDTSSWSLMGTGENGEVRLVE